MHKRELREKLFLDEVERSDCELTCCAVWQNCVRWSYSWICKHVGVGNFCVNFTFHYMSVGCNMGLTWKLPTPVCGPPTHGNFTLTSYKMSTHIDLFYYIIVTIPNWVCVCLCVSVWLSQRFTFKKIVCAKRAHRWECYVPSGDFICPSEDLNLDSPKSFQDSNTTWRSFSYIFKELSNDSKYMALWSMWRWFYGKSYMNKIQIMGWIGAPLHILCAFLPQ